MWRRAGNSEGFWETVCDGVIDPPWWFWCELQSLEDVCLLSDIMDLDDTQSTRTQLLRLFPEIMTRLHVYFVVSRFMLTSRLWIGCFLKNCDDVFMGRLSRLLSLPWPTMAKLYHKKPFRWGVWGCGTGGNCSVHLNEIKSLSRFKVKRSDFILAWTHLYILNISMLMLN